MANYKIQIKPSAAKELEPIRKRRPEPAEGIDLQRIVEKIQRLSEDPRPIGCLRLSGQQRHRIRQGNYRVIYAIDDRERTVCVVKAAHRREAYR